MGYSPWGHKELDTTEHLSMITPLLLMVWKSCKKMSIFLEDTCCI